MSRTRHARRLRGSALGYKRWRRRNVLAFEPAPRDVRRDEPDDLADLAPRFVPMGASGDEKARARAASRARGGRLLLRCGAVVTFEIVVDERGRAFARSVP